MLALEVLVILGAAVLAGGLLATRLQIAVPVVLGAALGPYRRHRRGGAGPAGAAPSQLTNHLWCR